MENLLWIISGVVLLMALTALKSVWKLKSQVKSLELDIQIAKGSMKDARDFTEETAKTLKSQLARLAGGENITPEMVLTGRLYKDLAPYDGVKLYHDFKDLFVLDVRTRGEYEAGHILKAKHIPIEEIDARIRELPTMKSARILVYCQSGGRSAAASEHLSRIGFTQVHNLQGGMGAWTGAQETGIPAAAGAKA